MRPPVQGGEIVAPSGTLKVSQRALGASMIYSSSTPPADAGMGHDGVDRAARTTYT